MRWHQEEVLLLLWWNDERSGQLLEMVLGQLLEMVLGQLAGSYYKATRLGICYYEATCSSTLRVPLSTYNDGVHH